MSEIIDISVGITEERIEISTTEVGIPEINATPTIIEVNIVTGTAINPQSYDLSDFTNNSSNPFVQYSALAGFVPTSRLITINGVTQDLSIDRSWTVTAATVWGGITGTLALQTDLQSALNAKQNILTLTTTGSSGASTLIGATLNIPTYTLAGLGGISLTSLSSTATGLTYTNTTGVFSLTSGYLIPTTASYNNANWDSAYTNRITSLTTTGSGAATLIGNVLNIPTPAAATFVSLTTTGSSGSSTLIGGILNVPTYTLSGLGGVPDSRTLTINGTTYDLSADRSWTIATGLTVGTTPISSGTVGRILFEGAGNVLQESANLFWDNTNGRLGIGGTPGAFNLDVVGTAKVSGNITVGSSTQYLNTYSDGSGYKGINMFSSGNFQTKIISAAGGAQFSGYDGSDVLHWRLQSGALNINRIFSGSLASVTYSPLAFESNYFPTSTSVAAYTFKTFTSSGSGVTIQRLQMFNGDNGKIVLNETGGNVLIGTSTDAGFKLDVNGTTRLQANTTIVGTNTPLSITGNGTSAFSMNSGNDVYFAFSSQSAVGRFYANPQGTIQNTYDRPVSVGFVGTLAGSDVWYGNMHPNGGAVKYNASENGASHSHIWYYNFTERMRLVSSGNLLIGTSTDSGYKLDVQGNTRITGAIYDSTASPGTSGQVLSSTVTGTAWQSLPSLTGFVPYTGATTNVDLGEYELKAGQLTLDLTPTGTAAIGTTQWNDSIGASQTTLKGGTVILKNGVDLVARVVNKVTPNATLTKANYTAVRISGAQGQRLAVEYAQANNDNNSADTIGLVCETIATNQEGFIITVGQIEDVNTTGSLQGETWADGDVLYLSPTVAGRLTNIKPTGLTGHIVVMGYVEYAHAVHGKIYVKVMNGWELDELHNVYINTTTLANNDLIQYDSSDSLWKNKSLSAAGIQSTITLTTTGTSGPATLVGSTLNIPQYGGGGGGGTIYKLTAQTLTAASWTLSGSYYIYTFSNVNITVNTRVDFTPDNASYSEVTTCGMLPQVDVFAGTCTFYSLFPPQNDITGEITIFPTV
jgi:hypothetical protein